jgi:hypothetical protein
MATSIADDCGRIRVSVVEHSDGSISVSYLPLAIEEPEMDPVNVDERSTEEMLGELLKLSRFGMGLQKKLRKMEKVEKKVEALPLIKVNPVDLLPPRKLAMYEAMSSRTNNPWCAQVVRELEEEFKLVVGPPKKKVGGRPGVGVVMVNGDAMEVPV